MIKEHAAVPMYIASTLSPNQQALFYGEYNRRARDYNTALALAILTGWWAGGHKFYLGKPIQGVLYILFAASTIPFFLTIFDIIHMRRTVDDINQEIAQHVAAHIRSMTM